MSSVTFGLILRVLSLIASAWVACQLYRYHLHRRYHILFVFLIFRVIAALYQFFLDVRSSTYFYIWAIEQPLFWLFYALMVVELSRLVLERYKGLYTIFRVAVIVSTVVSATISVLSLIPKIRPHTAQRSKIFGLFVATERGLELSLALFIILILLFLSRYPVVLSRNARAHAVIFTVYFLANTLGLLLRTYLGLKLANEVEIVFAVTDLGAIVAWLVLLKPAGETVPEIGSRLTTAHEQRLLTQLEAFNTTLLRSSRR